MKNFFQNSPDEKSTGQELSENILENKAFVPFSGGNFFNGGNSQKQEKKQIKPFEVKRLNDFDDNILRESALFNFEDKDIRLEEKIKMARELLASYKEKISLMEFSSNPSVKNKLVSQKEDLEGILSNLNSELKKGSLSKNISSKINKEKKVLEEKINGFKTLYNEKFHPYEILHKFFPRIYQIKILKKSLNKLKKINSLVKDLSQSQTPYGENDMKYQSLIAYLSSASSVHSKLRKKIGN